MNTTTTQQPTWGETLPGIWKHCHDRGFAVILRDGYVHLFHYGAPRHCLKRPIDRGRWMLDMPLIREAHLYDRWPAEQPGEWVDCSKDLDVQTVMEFRAVCRDCYCYKGVQRCDFCTGMRRPDRSRNEYASHEEAAEMIISLGYTQVAGSRFEHGDKWAGIYGDGSNAGMPTVYVVREGEHR